MMKAAFFLSGACAAISVGVILAFVWTKLIERDAYTR
jgi:hypothetical protein